MKILKIQSAFLSEPQQQQCQTMRRRRRKTNRICSLNNFGINRKKKKFVAPIPISHYAVPSFLYFIVARSLSRLHMQNFSHIPSATRAHTHTHMTMTTKNNILTRSTRGREGEEERERRRTTICVGSLRMQNVHARNSRQVGRMPHLTLMCDTIL